MTLTMNLVIVLALHLPTTLPMHLLVIFAMPLATSLLMQIYAIKELEFPMTFGMHFATTLVMTFDAT